LRSTRFSFLKDGLIVLDHVTQISAEKFWENKNMTNFKISDMSLGDIDSKNEILKQRRLGSNVFYDSFLIPLGFKEQYITTGSRYFICGQKGVGKTALLRWIKQTLEKNSEVLMILFKTGVREEDRQLLSNSMGYELANSVDKKEFVFQQDFKYAWSLYIHRIVALNIRVRLETL
jgi:hypothetical protein